MQDGNDLVHMISTWIDDGNQVILMIDGNTNSATAKNGSFCYNIEEVGLNELILAQHPRLKPPTIKIPGSQTIDNVFGSPTLYVINGGYAPFLGLYINNYHG